MTATISKLSTTTVSFDNYTSLDFEHPAKYSFKDAMGQYVYIHTRSRQVAQDYVDETYGKGKYKVGAAK